MDKIGKKGIALFITLLIIVSILSIIAISFTYLEKAKIDSNRVSAIIQGNLLYNNTVSVLKKIFPQGTIDAKKAKLVYSIPINLEEKKSGFNILLECKPLLVAIPINWYNSSFLDDKSKDKNLSKKYYLAEDVLDKLLREHNVEDVDTFKSILSLEIESKSDVSDTYNRLNKKSGIYSKAQFEDILNRYFFKTEDSSIFKINWDRYFIFVDVTDVVKIDGEYATSELISIAFDIPLDSVREDWSIGGLDEDDRKSLKEFLVENGVDSEFENLFSKEPLNAMRCEERFFFKDRHYSFIFDYSNERSVNFEFNGEI